jgi:hypothetical protein
METLLIIIMLVYILYGIKEITRNIKNINEYKKKLRNLRF